MTEIVLWLITFGLILYFCLTLWQTRVSAGLNKVIPRILKSGDENRWVWSISLAILGATTLVRPVDILLTVTILALVGLIVTKLVGWAMAKTEFH